MSSIKASVMIALQRIHQMTISGIDPHSDFIRQLSSYGTPTIRIRIVGAVELGKWKNNILVTKALKGSSIAALSLDDTTTPLHLFYQDPELHVRDLFNQGGSEWYHGEQILALSLSMNESSLHYRFPGLWHTTAWNAYRG
jgi:hypothetical protein